MVWMNEWDQKRYPALTKFVRDELYDHVRANPWVWHAFLKHSELSEAAAFWALKWGTLPVLDVRVLVGANGRYDGQVKTKELNRIMLSRAIAQRFEKDFLLDEAIRMVESTILHEMVHWGDHKDGADQTGEEGKAFEREAYGFDVNRYW